jgi:hypothetical protein
MKKIFLLVALVCSLNLYAVDGDDVFVNEAMDFVEDSDGDHDLESLEWKLLEKRLFGSCLNRSLPWASAVTLGPIIGVVGGMGTFMALVNQIGPATPGPAGQGAGVTMLFYALVFGGAAAILSGTVGSIGSYKISKFLRDSSSVYLFLNGWEKEYRDETPEELREFFDEEYKKFKNKAYIQDVSGIMQFVRDAIRAHKDGISQD